MYKPPVATYRLQINKDFTLQDAAKALPYMKSLGITHIYLSPIFESTLGSTHGYDICDFTKISEERGGEDAFAALDALCRTEGMRIILDIVPNHMGIAGDNPFWLDVLAKGKESEYWPLFDLRVDGEDKIHLPILDKPLEDMMAEGGIEESEHPIYGRALKVGERTLPRSQDALEDECYKLVQWTEVFEKISYRRFFDITDLIGVRVEDRDIYALSHRCLLDLCRKYTSIAGVRVDHIDGLADPGTYLSLLQKDVADIWVEKILSDDEMLPPEWPVHGTTGYEFTARLNALMVDPKGFRTLQKYWYDKIEPQWKDFEACVLKSKEDVLDALFPSEIKRLIKFSEDIGTPEQAEIFWRGMTVMLDAYRTYAGEKPLSDLDQQRVTETAERAARHFGKPFVEAQKIFLPVILDPQTDTHKQLLREWQQLSGPAMAKGLEDCAHYRYNPLAALNEVGCDSEVPENGAARYMEWCNTVADKYPHCLLATSTHDTKRSEDTRARLYTLADKPEAWIAYFESAVRLSKKYTGEFTPRAATEYFLYQAIIGIWPWQGEQEADFTDRICAYMQKSVREARVETSWLKPDTTYEKGLESFIRSLLADEEFVAKTRDYVEQIAAAGAVNSLTALTLKILGPGIPDIYQGTDGWAFSLVDPDNRRPVNFPANVPDRDDAESHGALEKNWRNPNVKIRYMKTLLTIRHEHGRDNNALIPISVAGSDKEHVLAYSFNDLIVLCPLCPGGLSLSGLSCKIAANVSFSAGVYTNLLTGQRIETNGEMPWSAFSGSPTAVLRKTG